VCVLALSRPASPTPLRFGTSRRPFDVEGVRFGCALGMESVYPELFLDYERAEVHCVLLSTHGPGASFALQAQGHASTNSYWDQLRHPGR
jgi:predicted amidohydrolase